MSKPRPTLNVANNNTTANSVTGSRQHSEFDFGSRQETMLRPGEVWTPGVRPTPLVDWAQGDSMLWETKDGGGSTAHNTPLAGYGRGDLWSAAERDDEEEARQQAATTAMFAVEAARAATPSPESSMGYQVSAGPTYTSQQQLYPSDNGRNSAGPFGVTPNANTPVVLSRQTSESLLARMRSSMDTEYLMNKYRSQSEILSDQLFFLAQMFPPPPPPTVPMETRRARAELWYSISRKWDLTQRLPPPPRSPLPGMEEEHRLRLQDLTRVPYRGDRWLAQSERWFRYVQDEVFQYPADNTALPLEPEVVLGLIA